MGLVTDVVTLYADKWKDIPKPQKLPDVDEDKLNVEVPQLRELLKIAVKLDLAFGRTPDTVDKDHDVRKLAALIDVSLDDLVSADAVPIIP